MNTPSRWLILDLGEGVYKLFCVWAGGYLDGDSWKLNSGIKAVHQKGDYYLFEGFSGSIYECHKGGRGTTAYGASIIDDWKSSGALDFEVMPDTFNPMNLNPKE